MALLDTACLTSKNRTKRFFFKVLLQRVNLGMQKCIMRLRGIKQATVDARHLYRRRASAIREPRLGHSFLSTSASSCMG